jgi:hypothetical protein
MISAKEMNELGLPNHLRIMPLTMKIINRGLMPNTGSPHNRADSGL